MGVFPNIASSDWIEPSEIGAICAILRCAAKHHKNHAAQSQGRRFEAGEQIAQAVEGVEALHQVEIGRTRRSRGKDEHEDEVGMN